MPDPSLPFLSNVQSFFQALKEPLFDSFLQGVLLEYTKPARMPHEWQTDESVASFVSRRFNPQIADNLVSAMMHGIYSGDIEKLSAQTVMGPMRNLEDGGVLYSGFMRAFCRQQTRLMDDYLAVDITSESRRALEFQPDILETIKKSSTFTFKGGVQQLPQALAASLKASSKVEVKTNSGVEAMSKSRDSNNINVCPHRYLPSHDWVLTHSRLNLRGVTIRRTTMSLPLFPRQLWPKCWRLLITQINPSLTGPWRSYRLTTTPRQ